MGPLGEEQLYDNEYVCNRDLINLIPIISIDTLTWYVGFIALLSLALSADLS